MQKLTARRGAAAVALFTLASFALGRLGLIAVDKVTGAALVWPLAGLLLAMLLVAPRRLRAPLLAAAALGDFGAALTAGVEPDIAAGIALADAVAAVIGALGVRRIAGSDWDPSSLSGTVALIGGGAVIGGCVGGLLGGSVLALAGDANPLDAFGIRWATHALGVITVSPLALVLAGRARIAPLERASAFERLVAHGGTVAASAMLFLGDGGPFDMPVLIVPFIAIAALRLGWADTALSLLIACTAAVISTYEGKGPLASGPNVFTDIFATDVAATVLGGTMLVVAAVTGERAGALVRLRREREMLAEAQRAAQLGSWTVDLDTGETRWSAQQFRNFGMEPRRGTLSPADFMTRIHPDDRELVRAIARGEIVPERGFEFRVLRPDGTTGVLVAHGSLRTTKDGRRLLTGTTRDVTAERQAERALDVAEERFRRAFEDSPAGMAILSIEGGALERFEDANAAMARLLGVPRERLLGSRWADYVAGFEEDDPVAGRGIKALLAGERKTLTLEVRLRGPKDAPRWASCGISLVREEGGRAARALLQAHDVTERKQVEGQLQFLADHDPLTGLLNRRRFMEELEREVNRVQRYGGECAVMMVDLDWLKPVNDTAGHAVGDRILVTIADVLRSRLRATDLVGRLGGDEFGVILPETSREDAARLASELRASVAQHMRQRSSAIEARVTASIGISGFSSDEGQVTADELLIEADLAMYSAKEAGRDRVRVHERSAPREGRAGWVTHIREAIAQDRFVLHAQPIVPILIDDPRPRYELLLRMTGGAGELIAPNRFLAVADRFGLMPEIDRWVLGEAARILGERRRRGEEIVLAVNLAATSISDPGVVDRVAAALSEHDADPSCLVLEMTEAEALVNVEMARAFIEDIMSLGCEVALDNFGAGFASFYYLKHLGFDYVKIDGEFVESLVDDRTDRTVVEALVHVARNLGKRTIAERVGDALTVEALRELGVDYGQGYFLGRPQPLRDLRADGATATL
jgi:diguanylate cyclase (GGDEF)-like protein/PAS domain S-box-containing protein